MSTQETVFNQTSEANEVIDQNVNGQNVNGQSDIDNDEEDEENEEDEVNELFDEQYQNEKLADLRPKLINASMKLPPITSKKYGAAKLEIDKLTADIMSEIKGIKAQMKEAADKAEQDANVAKIDAVCMAFADLKLAERDGLPVEQIEGFNAAYLAARDIAVNELALAKWNKVKATSNGDGEKSGDVRAAIEADFNSVHIGDVMKATKASVKAAKEILKQAPYYDGKGYRRGTLDTYIKEYFERLNVTLA